MRVMKEDGKRLGSRPRVKGWGERDWRWEMWVGMEGVEGWPSGGRGGGRGAKRR